MWHLWRQFGCPSFLQQHPKQSKSVLLDHFWGNLDVFQKSIQKKLLWDVLDVTSLSAKTFEGDLDVNRNSLLKIMSKWDTFWYLWTTFNHSFVVGKLCMHLHTSLPSLSLYFKSVTPSHKLLAHRGTPPQSLAVTPSRRHSQWHPTYVTRRNYIEQRQ